MSNIVHCEEVQWCSLRSMQCIQSSDLQATIECSTSCNRVCCNLRSSVPTLQHKSSVLQPEDQFHLLSSLSTLSLRALLRNQTFCKLSERPMSVTHVFCVPLPEIPQPVHLCDQTRPVRPAMRLTMACFLFLLLSQALASEDK